MTNNARSKKQRLTRAQLAAQNLVRLAEDDYKAALALYREGTENPIIVEGKARDALGAIDWAWCQVQEHGLPEQYIELLYWRAHRLKTRAVDRRERHS